MSLYLNYITLTFWLYLSIIDSDRLNIPGMYSCTKIRTPSCSSTIRKDSGFEPGPLGIWVTFHLNPMGFSRASGIWDLSVSKLFFFSLSRMFELKNLLFIPGISYIILPKAASYNACAMRMSLARLPVSNVKLVSTVSDSELRLYIVGHEYINNIQLHILKPKCE